MNSYTTQRCAQYAVLLAALATGSYLTTFMPAPRPHTIDVPSATTTLNQASTHNTVVRDNAVVRGSHNPAPTAHAG